MTKFGFLLHPRTQIASDMGQLFGAPFGWVPDQAYNWALSKMPVPPLVTGRIRFDHSEPTPEGLLVTVPLSAPLLLGMNRRDVQHRVEDAVDKARDLGAGLVGLGGLTAPVTVGGKAFLHRTDIGITNGNAFTAAMTYLAIERLLPHLPIYPVIALVGATGSVGACVTQMVAERHLGQLLLVARNEERLELLRAPLQSKHVRISTDMLDVRQADLIILMTSAADALLHSEHLKEGAIVLDDTQPRNTSPALVQTRPDVQVVDGGLVEIPSMRLKGTIGLKRGLAYACLAETMLLALDGHRGHFSLGHPRVDQAEYMLHLADRHAHLGFHLAPFHGFGEPVEVKSPLRPVLQST
ncbi:semialdehyde dehydrogenase [Deinococcus xianganensis]|uniref:Semialdehyde dehydrogenase n=1 Tax=Deinococcus xianganensis TaxID=1507289 RepID=A0A6I4YPB7_9DEIO|nr:semialdehyde dehydrogenase [Deinococcus xianganensis]MXV20867.1 semialdehyde dehydrogenase [Deinococcus xianganensis]